MKKLYLGILALVAVCAVIAILVMPSLAATATWNDNDAEKIVDSHLWAKHYMPDLIFYFASCAATAIDNNDLDAAKLLLEKRNNWRLPKMYAVDNYKYSRETLESAVSKYREDVNDWGDYVRLFHPLGWAYLIAKHCTDGDPTDPCALYDSSVSSLNKFIKKFESEHDYDLGLKKKAEDLISLLKSKPDKYWLEGGESASEARTQAKFIIDDIKVSRGNHDAEAAKKIIEANKAYLNKIHIVMGNITW